MSQSFLPKHGGYRNLRSYQKSVIVYDATVYFCGRYLSKRDRTFDQMIQAARSGKQNIVEGSMASGTSKETELKLTNVARASLEELLEDYQDFLRARNSGEWPTDHAYTKRLRVLCRKPDGDYETFKKGIEHEDPLISANVIIGLIRVTCYLLNRQIAQLQEAFVEQGGVRERMSKARLERRAEQQREDRDREEGRRT
ncbi:MAG: four helix bundle protein [Candidatus Hydrogenedentes bacterium]|nr:four helix bundle protein [Candidatus Hydrogenedentota bacterium]